MEWGMQKIFVLLPSNSFKVWVFRLIFIVFVTEIFAWHTSSIVVMDSCLLWVCFSLKRSCRGTTSRDCSSSRLDKSGRVEKAHSDADNISVATALQPWLAWFSTRSTRVMYHPQVPRLLSRVEQRNRSSYSYWSSHHRPRHGWFFPLSRGRIQKELVARTYCTCWILARSKMC